MRIFPRLPLVIAVVIFAYFGLLFAWFVWPWVHDYVSQTQGPVSREKSEAAGCPIPLPASAHDVQYAWVAGGLQYCMQYVRFEAPVADCFAHARLMFSKFGKNDPNYKIPEFFPTDHPIRPPTCPDLHTEWFDVETMPEGVVTPEGSSNGPQIWIDTKRGVFYFYLTD